MHAFEVLGDPIRRRIIELLAAGEQSSGEIVTAIGREFGITQSAVSQHLRVLRDSGFAVARAEGPRRLYSIEPGPFRVIEAWLDGLHRFWDARLDALATEIARGKHQRRLAAGNRKPRSDS